MKNFRENFKFNQTDPAVTPGRHDWNVFVARKLEFNFVSSEERLVFLGEDQDDVYGNWGGRSKRGIWCVCSTIWGP